MLDIEIPKEAIEDVCEAGYNTRAVSKWCAKLNIQSMHTKREFAKMYDSYGVDSWDNIIGKSLKELAEFCFWCECWDQFEYMNEENK